MFVYVFCICIVLVFSGARVVWSLVFCVVFYRSLFVLLVIVLSVLLRFTDFDNPFSIFNLFSEWMFDPRHSSGLTPSPFTEVFVPNKESEQLCICVLGSCRYFYDFLYSYFSQTANAYNNDIEITTKNEMFTIFKRYKE